MAHFGRFWTTSRNMFVYRHLIDIKWSTAANPTSLGYYLIDVVSPSMGRFFVVDILYILEKAVEAVPNTDGAAPTLSMGIGQAIPVNPGGTIYDGYTLNVTDATAIHGNVFQPFSGQVFVPGSGFNFTIEDSDRVPGVTSFNKVRAKSNVILQPNTAIIVRNSGASSPAPAQGSHFYVTVFVRGYSEIGVGSEQF